MDLEVEPNNWILPNRIAYNNYIYNTFHPSKYPIKKSKKAACECENDVCDIPSETISLFPQQRIVRDFIQVRSPYRGLLLYHELGAGKSGASIAAAEGYINRKKIFVMTPASLAQNYENELMKISTIGLNLKKSWTLLKVDIKNKNIVDILLNQYAISGVKKDGLVWVPLYQNDIPDAVVITNGKKYSSLSSEEKEKIDATIINIIRNRYTFISYNGLTQKTVKELTDKGFDNSFIIIDEIHNFISRVVNGSRLVRGIYNSIMTAKDCKLILLSGTPIINNPYEIATLINLIRGPMNIYGLKLLKSSSEPTNATIIQNMKQNDFEQYIDEIHYDNNDRLIYISLLPSGYARRQSDNIDIIPKDWKMTPTKLIEKIITSLNTIKGIQIGKIASTLTHYALPNNKDDFNKTFIDLSNIETPTVKNTDLFQRRILGTLSYYRVSGSDFFPKIISNNIEYLPMTDHQLSVYADVRAKERAIENSQKRSASMDIFSNKSSVYRAFSRMVCNFAFPEEIKRTFPQDIRRLIIKDMGAKDDDDDESDDEEIDDKTEAKKKKEQEKKIKQEYENMLDKATKTLMTSDYLNKENLQKIYSPKYAKMLDDIEESPGTVLIYSQFRTMEGLGIFSKVLDAQGYKEIVIKHTEGGYIFEDLSIFDEKYNHKRYVIFSSDRVKTNILMNLFNGSFNLLPDSIKQQLTENSKDQLYGKFVKIMMITQSGAEGISLKNVRRVLIMEYFWNSVRINQVIGRAVRTCSHEMLPESERNVEIFTYIMKFTKAQMEKDFTLRTLDKEKTTDEHILEIANKKQNIINEFLTMLKASSFDCIINSVQNKPLQEGYKCYNWAINSDGNKLSYTPDIASDNKILREQKYQVARTNRGTVVSRNGNKYILINNKLYDYFSYKNAGILLPV
jgi:superfamily II DNA or RNA helicase